MKLENELSEQFLGSEGFQDTWTTNTFRHKANQVTDQLVRLTEVNTELVMAREEEKSSVEKLMELMVKMRMDDKKEMRERDERLERIRTERDEKREEEWQEREERLLISLKAAQPSVPQKVTINSNRLPSTKEGNDIETFLPQLKGALVALNVPVEDWKGHIYSQVTTAAKDNVMHLLSDESATYNDVEEGLLGVASMSFANAAEAIFSPMTSERSREKPRKIIKQVARWVD